MIKSLAAAAIFYTALACPSQATVKNYFSPQVDGTRLAACLADPNSCGKPTADAFCIGEGFTGALVFQREAAATTRQLGSGEICEGENCVSFRQIKCLGPAKPADLAQN